MTHRGKFLLRLGISGGVLVYLIGDLYFWGGPLRQRIHTARHTARHAAPAMAASDTVVARVHGHQIDASQLERAVRERLWLEGKTPADLGPQDRRLVRQAALEDLIDHELLRAKVAASTVNLPVGAEELNERVHRFTARFASTQELEAALASQGIPGEQALRERLAARIQQGKYVESRIAPLAWVSDEEARKWYEENHERLATPGRVEARHIFLPTLERDAGEVKQALEAALAALTEKTKDFATLARELSEDPLTKDRGGALGWMTRERLPADLAAPMFSLPLHQPSLVRSKLGWHLLEVTARKPAQPRTFEQAKAEIVSALEAVKRRRAAADFRAALRRFEARNIEILRERVEE